MSTLLYPQGFKYPPLPFGHLPQIGEHDLGESMKAVLAAVDFFRETLGMNEEE